jgi:hypothetical protein
MRPARRSLRAFLGRLAGTRSLDRPPAQEARPRGADAQNTGAGPAAYDDGDRELLDRERQLRIMMASWM